MLEEIELPPEIDLIAVPQDLRKKIDLSHQRIEAFQDSWQRNKIEQFVAADYVLVYQALSWVLASQTTLGNRFLEWGCGFAVVSCLASQLGLDAIGIEAESELLRQGRTTVDQFGLPVELHHGNFLPPGTEQHALDPTLPSLGHDVADAYASLSMELCDFSIVYSYPWPGEDLFHEDVFDHEAAPGALLLMFCGPYQMRLMRKRR